MSDERVSSLVGLHHAITACSRCPRLRAHCTEIARVRKREFRDQAYWGRPVPGFGDPRARLLIVGLAPAAHGANRTGRVFTGDSSGDWLWEALHRYGWASLPTSRSTDDGMVLTGCYITAAARCAPPDNKPTAEELDRCRPWLEAELAVLREVRVILVLGRIGWERWLRASGWWARLGAGGRPAFGHGAEAELPDGTVLLSSFHPSRQNTNTGKLSREMWHAVFARARALVAESVGPPTSPAAPGPPSRRSPSSPAARRGSSCPVPRAG